MPSEDAKRLDPLDRLAVQIVGIIAKQKIHGGAAIEAVLDCLRAFLKGSVWIKEPTHD